MINERGTYSYAMIKRKEFEIMFKKRKKWKKSKQKKKSRNEN